MEKTTQLLREQKSKNQSLMKRFFITLIIMLITTLVQVYLYDFVIPAPFLLFYPSVILASLYGEGISAIILSAFITQYYFIYPHLRGVFHFPHDLIRISVFTITSFLIMKIIHNLQHEKIKVEAALALIQQREKDLEAEKEAREKFVWTLNHDLKNPLTALRMNAQILTKKFGEVEGVKTISEKQIKIISRMDQMINDLLDANKISAGGHLDLELEKVDIAEIIWNTVQELELIHGKRFVLKECESSISNWSSMGVRRILENLCSNAAKYGEEKGTIEISCRKEEKGISLSVNNKGPVIPFSERAELFHPFKRASTADHKSKKGWGLGLTLVKGLSEAMGGNVTFTSDSESGTTFTIYLPLQ